MSLNSTKNFYPVPIKTLSPINVSTPCSLINVSNTLRRDRVHFTTVICNLKVTRRHKFCRDFVAEFLSRPLVFAGTPTIVIRC